MGGRGASSSKASGINSRAFFNQDMTPQVSYFENVVDGVDSELKKGFMAYTSGVYGGDKKSGLDSQYGISDFIDSDASKPLRLNNNPTLYRGGTITDEQYNRLKVGGTLDAMHSKNELTSWSDRETTAHMYAEESKYTWGQGGNNSHDVVIVDIGKTNDAVVNPYTYPSNEVLRSKSKSYTITKIVDAKQYTKPIGRENEPNPYGYYTDAVTYIYVKSN